MRTKRGEWPDETQTNTDRRYAFDLWINLLIIKTDIRNITHPAPVYPTIYYTTSHSMPRWKARGRLPIGLWSLAIMVEALSGYWSKSSCSKEGWSLSAQISGGKGRPSRRLKSWKLQVKSSHEVVSWWLSWLSSRFGAKSSRERKPKWLPGLWRIRRCRLLYRPSSMVCRSVNRSVI